MDDKNKFASGVVNNVGIVETKYFTFAYPPEYFEFECGDRIGPVTLAYETYGRLNTNKSNAILVTHALPGMPMPQALIKETKIPAGGTT